MLYNDCSDLFNRSCKRYLARKTGASLALSSLLAYCIAKPQKVLGFPARRFRSTRSGRASSMPGNGFRHLHLLIPSVESTPQNILPDSWSSARRTPDSFDSGTRKIFRQPFIYDFESLLGKCKILQVDTSLARAAVKWGPEFSVGKHISRCNVCG